MNLSSPGPPWQGVRPARRVALRIEDGSLATFRIGLAAVAVQAALTREMIVRAGGTEPLIAVFASIWLLGSAIAGLAHAPGRQRLPGEFGNRAGGRQLLVGLGAAVAGLVAARSLPFLSTVAGEVPGIAQVVLLGLIVLAVPSALTSGLFPSAAAGSPPGAAYAAECAGATAGGLLASVLSHAGRSPLEILVAGAAAILLLRRRPRRGSVLAACALVGLLAGGVVEGADRILLRRAWEGRHPGIRLDDAVWTPARLVARAETGGEAWVYVDDALGEGIGDRWGHEPVAALVACAAPRVADVCLIGIVSPDVPSMLRQGGIARVTCIVEDRRDTILAGSVPGVRYLFGDARRVLRAEEAALGGFDVIAVGAGSQASLASNRLLTAEAFACYAARLREGGTILVIGAALGAAPAPESRAWRESVASAMRLAVGHVEARDGDRVLLAGSRVAGPLLMGDTLAARWRRSAASVPIAGYPAERFRVEYRADRALPLDPDVPPNRDMRPRALAHATALWLRLFGMPAGSFGVLRGWLTAIAIAAVVVSSLRGRRNATVLVASGAAGMAGSATILLSYQQAAGLLQAGLGVLLGAFFAGTAMGACCGSIAARRRCAPWWVRAASPAFAAIAFGIAILSLQHAGHHGLSGLPWWGAAAALLGSACGVWFALAAPSAGTRRAWAFDCAGGAAGAVAFTLWIDKGWLAVGGGVVALLSLCAVLLRNGARDA